MWTDLKSHTTARLSCVLYLKSHRSLYILQVVDPNVSRDTKYANSGKCAKTLLISNKTYFNMLDL